MSSLQVGGGKKSNKTQSGRHQLYWGNSRQSHHLMHTLPPRYTVYWPHAKTNTSPPTEHARFTPRPSRDGLSSRVSLLKLRTGRVNKTSERRAYGKRFRTEILAKATEFLRHSTFANVLGQETAPKMFSGDPRHSFVTLRVICTVYLGYLFYRYGLRVYRTGLCLGHHFFTFRALTAPPELPAR